MRHKTLMPLCLDNIVQVRWSVGMPPQTAQQLAHRAIIGDRVVFRFDPSEPVFTGLIGAEHAAQMWLELNDRPAEAQPNQSVGTMILVITSAPDKVRRVLAMLGAEVEEVGCHAP